LHILTQQPRTVRPRTHQLRTNDYAGDFARLAELWHANLDLDRLRAFADSLGVTAEALRSLGCGWNGRVFTFPMWSAQRRVVGIRLRDPRTGRKFAVRGSREGVFLPDGDPHELLLIVEGPTDAAAGLTLGFDVLGRPSCTGATCITAALTCNRNVVIVADADESGQRGAVALAHILVRVAVAVRVITPPAPHKDLRDWVRAGAPRSHVEAAIAAAPIRRLTMRYRHD